MISEEYLKELKTKYQNIETPLHLRESGWEELSGKLEPAPLVNRRLWVMRFAFISGIILVISGAFFGFYQVAAASLPGDLLYPVKKFSENIVQRATGDNQIVIDHRAEEIVNLAREKEVKTQELQQAVQEYKEVVTEARQEIRVKGQEDIQFEKRLEEQHREFDRVAKEAPTSAGEIKDAQEVSNHTGSEHGGD